MMKVFCLFLLICLTGCADRYSLDKGRGPDPRGIVTNNPLVLPPDYLLRAPEPAAPEQNQTEKKESAETPAPAAQDQAAVREEVIEISDIAETVSAEE